MHRMPARLRLLHWRSATRAVCLAARRMMNFMVMHAAWGIQGQTLPKPFLSVWKCLQKTDSISQSSGPGGALSMRLSAQECDSSFPMILVVYQIFVGPLIIFLRQRFTELLAHTWLLKQNRIAVQ